MFWLRWVLIIFSVLAVSSCKLRVVTPLGGNVTTDSGSYTCEPDKPCDIDVVDLFFDETFSANPAPGYEFHAWRTQKRALCAGTAKPCSLSTGIFEDFPALMDLLASDEVFYLKPVFVKTTGDLRVFEEGDRIKYRGIISLEQPDGSQASAEVKGTREFFATENQVDETPVMLHQFTIRLDSDGSEYPEASFYFQDEDGAWFDVSDTGGNFIANRATRQFGVLGYPSPLTPTDDQTIQFSLVSAQDLSITIATGTLTLNVSKPRRIVVPLGAFRAFRVTSTMDLDVVIGESAGTRLKVVQKHWVVPHVGPVKVEFSQRTYDSRGNYAGTYASEFEATTINF